MPNERMNEALVRAKLRASGYYDDSETTVEEQISDIAAVKTLLRNASKGMKGGRGAPEFIISTRAANDVLIIIECKARLQDHESTNRNQPIRYAVDGALHYARVLSRDFTVIALATSGRTAAELRTSSFIWPRGDVGCKVLTTQAGQPVDAILPITDYVDLVLFDPEVREQRHRDLLAFSRELHDFMRDHAKLTESEKPLLVGGTLIALRDPAFRASYDKYTANDLQRQWLDVIQVEIDKADIPNSKRVNMAQPYSSIAVHPELGKPTPAFPRGVLYELIHRLATKVWPYVSIDHGFDVIGSFYGEFLKYTGGDKKALGIVLTPRHVTELFAMLANLQVDSRVLDTCCGTGGFLISSMSDMIGKASTKEQRAAIRSHGLVGVEQQPNMYALAASNMILRGDGKANLYQGSCFDDAIMRGVSSHKCNVGMINPPYSQRDAESRELVFVRYLLDSLTPGGTGIAIVPMSCAIGNSVEKATLLKAHTLEAVMSMPTDLFYPVGVVTCIMVLTAHAPHAASKRKTWFGYWKDDGFIKTKQNGRVDVDKRWAEIRDRWVSAFRNREVHAGESVMRAVTADDEWCAEAYMETNYSRLTRGDFEKVVRDYALFSLLGVQGSLSESETTGDD